MAESKHDKFVRLAESRMNATLKQIELLGNLANKSAYDYSTEEVQTMLKTLKSSIKELEETFFKETNTKKFQLK